MFFATANTPKPWLLQLWSFLYPRAWRCIALSLGTEILIMVQWAESSLHGFPEPPMFHLVSQNSNLQSCLCYSATLHCVFTQKLWELHFTSLIWVPIMATEWMNVTMSLLTCAHLQKEEFVWEHLGKTYHRAGCSCLHFCLQHDSLSTKEIKKGGLPSARCHSSKNSVY